MYQRIVSDPELTTFFANTSMDRLAVVQTAFLTSALDGPTAYTGNELTAIHHGRGITNRRFSLFCNHFADAAKAKGVNESDIE